MESVNKSSLKRDYSVKYIESKENRASTFSKQWVWKGGKWCGSIPKHVDKVATQTGRDFLIICQDQIKGKHTVHTTVNWNHDLLPHVSVDEHGEYINKYLQHEMNNTNGKYLFISIIL